MVRSAYHLAHSELASTVRNARGCSMSLDTQADMKFWKELWAIKTPERCALPSGDLHTTASQQPNNLCNVKSYLPHYVFIVLQRRVWSMPLLCSFARKVWVDVKKDFDIHLNHKFSTSPKTWLMSKCNGVQTM
jgi:hypothetical protein